MLITFGARRHAPDGVDLLLECHTRIRRHLTMARRLAAASGHPEVEIRETAAQVRRYFTEALPLHILDEEITIRELLAGHNPIVDAALARMAGDHLDHEPALGRLIDLCAELERAPGDLGGIAVELAALVAVLEAQLLEHLAMEERTIFAALRLLPASDRDALARAMRERRLSSRSQP